MYVHISNKVSGLIRFIFNNSKRLFSTTRQLYTFGVESFTDGWIREQCNLTSRFPNVFVQGLNLAKNRQTSLIWTEYNMTSFECLQFTSHCVVGDTPKVLTTNNKINKRCGIVVYVKPTLSNVRTFTNSSYNKYIFKETFSKYWKIIQNWSMLAIYKDGWLRMCLLPPP